MTTKRDCSGKIWGDYRAVSGRVYACSRPATVKRDGKWYCWQHDPERVKVDAKKRRAGWKAEMDREAAKYERIARNARLGTLVTLRLGALLERLAKEANLSYEKAGDCGDTGTEWAIQLHLDDKEARKLAAQIREALGEH